MLIIAHFVIKSVKSFCLKYTRDEAVELIMRDNKRKMLSIIITKPFMLSMVKYNNRQRSVDFYMDQTV